MHLLNDDENASFTPTIHTHSSLLRDLFGLVLPEEDQTVLPSSVGSSTSSLNTTDSNSDLSESEDEFELGSELELELGLRLESESDLNSEPESEPEAEKDQKLSTAIAAKSDTEIDIESTDETDLLSPLKRTLDENEEIDIESIDENEEEIDVTSIDEKQPTVHLFRLRLEFEKKQSAKNPTSNLAFQTSVNKLHEKQSKKRKVN